MGGNFICIAGGQPVMGNALSITRPGAIGKLRNDVIEMTYKLNDAHDAMFGYPLWPQLTSNLSTGLIFAGSTNHIFDKKITEEDLISGMDEVSDLDLYIPTRDRRGDTLSLLFKDLANSGSPLGAFTVMCYKEHDLKKKSSIPGETLAVDRGTNAIFKYLTESGDNAYIQIDFMPSAVPVGDEDPEDQKKMSLWVMLSHSSDWDDRKEGVKGVFHKYLIQSLFSVITRIAKGKIITAGSLKPKIVRNKQLGYDIKVKPPQVSDTETKKGLRMSSFSVEKAVSTKRLTIMKDVIDGIIADLPEDLPEEVKGLVRKEILNAISVAGLEEEDLYKKTSDISTDSEEDPRGYVTDVYEIFKMLFGFIPDHETLRSLYSFRGLLSLIRDHILPSENGQQKCREIFVDFIDRLFGPAAQEIDTQSGQNDAKKKNSAIERIKKEVEFKDLLPSESEIKQIRWVYYAGPEVKAPDDDKDRKTDDEDPSFTAFNTRMGSRQATIQRTKASLEESTLRLFVRGLLRA